MENNILVKGKGIISKIAINSVNGRNAFDGKHNKKLFIDILKDESNENVVLIAYCVLDAIAHFIVKSNSKGDADSYISRVTSRYGTSYDGKERGNPLRSDYVLQKVENEELDKAVAYVHSVAPVSARDYEFCSYNYLIEGTHGGTAVIIAENGGSMGEQEFHAWLNAATTGSYIVKNPGKESFSKVLKEDKQRYLTGQVQEKAVVCVLADLCERTGAKYKKAARALGISYKERRDVMIATLTELMVRGHGFGESVAIMKIFDEDRHALLLDCIVEENRVNAYSYDHIAYTFGIDDYYYDILAEILRGLHRKFGYGFEELCVRFHLQNDIIPLRAKCGF